MVCYGQSLADGFFKNKIILIKLLAALKQEPFPSKNVKTLKKIDADILENPN